MPAAAKSVRLTLKPSALFVSFVHAHAPGSPVPDTPSIAVPVSLNSPGLTQVVEQLLREVGISTPPFALLFRDVERDVVLSSSLEKYLARQHLTEEHALVLEYFPKPNEPQAAETCAVPDWISCIKAAPDGHVFASSFDGSVMRFASNCALQQRREACHVAPIKAIALMNAPDGRSFVFSASKDAAVSAWTASDLRKVAMCDNAGASAETLDAAQSSDNAAEALVLTGGGDGVLRLFQVKLDNLEDDEPRNNNNTNKRVQRDPALAMQPNVGVLVGHGDKVSAALWTKAVDPTSCYSASWDSTIRVWDVVRQVETASWRLPKAATCMATSAETQHVMVSGHADHVVRVWDARVAGGDSTCKMSLASHHGWVSAVAFGPREYVVVSASFDRTVKIWDVRRPAALHTIETTLAGRLFAVDWAGATGVYAGGSDAELRRYKTD